MTDRSDVPKEVVTRATLVEYIHARHPQITRTTAREVLNDFINGIIKALSDGYDVHLKGLGRLKRVERKARRFVVPSTGEAGSVPARHTVKLVPSKSLRWNDEETSIDTDE